MAATQKKRIWGENFEKVRKRQRVGGVRPPTKSGGAVLKPVSLDQLAWREVTLPDRLDDTEGFFGLEEIEHVEIVRDEESGTVEYRVGKKYNIPH
jgi:ATP-dependent RNA helicase DDX24/MAK5